MRLFEVMSFNPVPPLGTGNILITSVVNDNWLEVINPMASLCKSPGVVNFGRYNELNEFPIVTLPADVPVLILVALFELSFRFIAAPDIVAPKLPVSKPDEVMAPPTVV